MKIIIRLALSALLLFSTHMPADFIAYGGENSSALSPQLRLKPSAKIVKTSEGYAIIDDDGQTKAVGEVFKNDAEQVYLDILRQEANELGLSESGLQALVRQHAKKMFATRISDHTYTEVTGPEKEAFVNKLKNSSDSDSKIRLTKLIEVYNAGKNSHESNIDMVDLAALNSNTTIFQDMAGKSIADTRLLKDENGVYWILKKQLDPYKVWIGGWKRNVRKREAFASLLLQHVSNQAEIRGLTKEEALRSPDLAQISEKIDEYYLSRVISDGNLGESRLPHKDIRRASSAIFVSNILIRKFDPHLWNMMPLKGVPVSFDNDMALGFVGYQSHEGSLGYKRFELFFLRSFVYLLIRYGKVLDMNKTQGGSASKELIGLISKFDFDAMWRNPEEWVNETISAMRRFGLSDGIIAANMLDGDYMRESIMEHKKLENIRETAIAAGYEGKELDEVVAMISKNRETLGWDVNDILKAITGNDYGFDKIDKEYESSSRSKWGETFIDSLLLRAHEAMQRNEKIIIGIDSSWIPGEQRPYIQGLLSELGRLSRKKGLDNVIIHRRDGPELARVLKDEAMKTGTPLSNIVVLGDGDVLSERAFNALRPGNDSGNWAFFALVETPENFPRNSYIRLVEMLTVAVNLAFGGSRYPSTPYIEVVQSNVRMFRFIIPKPEPMDYEALKEMYNSQIKVMAAA